MIVVRVACETAVLNWCKHKIIANHYLHTPVHPRSQPLYYVVEYHRHSSSIPPAPVGLLVCNRTEATRCFQGGLTYGSLDDVDAGRAQYSRWEILSLARVWLDPVVQSGGLWVDNMPGYTDRRGVWRSTLASTVISMAIEQVVIDYLLRYPPVWIDQPYAIKVISSYCDTRVHKGTIYRSSGFHLAHTNQCGIETWMKDTRMLTGDEDARIRKLSEQHPRSQAIRRQYARDIRQEVLI